MAAQGSTVVRQEAVDPPNIRLGLELAWCHFCHLLLVRAVTWQAQIHGREEIVSRVTQNLWSLATVSVTTHFF